MAVGAIGAYVEGAACEVEPLYGARGEPLSTETLVALGARFAPGYHNPVRTRQAVRYDVLNSKTSEAVKARLFAQYTSPIVREGTEPHITRTLNPAADIVGRVCQVYRQGVRRWVEGVSETKAKAFQQLYKEANIPAYGQDWNKIGYFVGPLHAVPRVRTKRMAIDNILPHRSEVVLDEDDPTGAPVAIAYKAASANHMIVVDHATTTTYALLATGPEVVGKPQKHTPAKDGTSTPFPELRFDAPIDPEDWSNSWRNDRLVDGTIDATVVATVMGFVRQTQNKWLLFLSGQLDKMPKGQNLGDPEAPVAIHTDQGRMVQLQAIQFDTPVTNFIEQIRFLYAVMAESTGVPAMIATEGARVDLEFAFDGLTELRNEQIVFAERFELDLALAMVLAAKDGGHPMASKLPTPEEVAKGFRVNFGRMGRRFTDPQQERDQADFEIRHGMISILELVGDRYKSLDRDELQKQIEANLELNGKLWDMLAARNVGADSEGKAVTGPQQNGAKGPQERDKGKKVAANVTP